MGDLFGGSTKTTSSQTTDTGPSKFQLPYLSSAFDAAKANFTNQSGTPFYQGELYAGMSDAQKQALAAKTGYATGTTLPAAAALTNMGTGLVGNAKTAQDLLGRYSDLASTDATAANIAAASKYAANPYLDGQIDAVNRDVGRQLSEETLPGIDRAASASGNINSSRAGVASGIAQRGAADRMADNAASLRGQAYSQGLGLAAQERANTLSAMATAANGYSGLAGQGISAIEAGNSLASGAYDAISSAGAADQADRQGKNDAAYAQWQGNDTRATDLLDRYFKIVGGNAWGSSGTSSGTQTTKQSQGLLTGLAGIASTGLGLAGGLGWKPFA